MGSYKISFTYFLFQKDPGQSYSEIKTEPKLSGMKISSVLNIGMHSRYSGRLGPWQGTFLAVSSIPRAACALGSGWLHSRATAVLGSHPIVLVSSALTQLGCPYQTRALFRDSDPPLGASLQLISMISSNLGALLQLRLHTHHWPLTLQSLSCSPSLLRAFKTSTIWETYTLLSVAAGTR